MTWDHIAIVIVGGGLSAILAVMVFAFLLEPRWRSSPRRKVLTGVWFAGTLVAFTSAWYDNMGVASEEYPILLQAYHHAPERAAEMRAVLREAYPRREVFSMALSQRDRFLRAGGYCTWMRETGCRALPVGHEAQGIAIELMGDIAAGHSHGVPEKV